MSTLLPSIIISPFLIQIKGKKGGKGMFCCPNRLLGQQLLDVPLKDKLVRWNTPESVTDNLFLVDQKG